jgi:flagellar basal body-associated protein FliL
MGTLDLILLVFLTVVVIVGMGGLFIFMNNDSKGDS